MLTIDAESHEDPVTSTRMHNMLAEAEAELVATEVAAMNLRLVVDGLRGLLSGVQSPVRPTEAVRRTLEAHPNEPMDFKAIWGYITERGWDDPAYKAYRNASDGAARRLSASSSEEVRRLDDGRYVYSVEADTPS